MARKKEAMAYFSIESALALVISLFINLCVVSVFAKGFYGKEAGDIGLKNAGDYLGDRFGSHMVHNHNKEDDTTTIIKMTIITIIIAVVVTIILAVIIIVVIIILTMIIILIVVIIIVVITWQY